MNKSNSSEQTKSHFKDNSFKRKLKIPLKITDNETAEVVASFVGPIQTISIETIDKEILLDRLSIEIIRKYNYTLSNPTKKVKTLVHSSNEPRKKKKKRFSATTVQDCSNMNTKSFLLNDSQEQQYIIRQRLIVGINQVTRLLESTSWRTLDQSRKPLLVFLTNNVRPPTMVMHIPYLCRQFGIPIVLIPGIHSSAELGKVFGIKCVSAVAFTSRSSHHVPDRVEETSCTNITNDCHADIDSFIDFAISKIPLSST